MSGYYEEETGKHICPSCHNYTNYAAMSGGREWRCDCGMEGVYPEGEGGPRARLLDQGPEGFEQLKRDMLEHLDSLKKEGK